MILPDPADARLVSIFRIIAAAEPLGVRTLATGVRLVGHVPHVAPEAYLHVVFPPLEHSAIDALEAAIRRPLPPSYREFLSATNGLNLFSNSLSIFGGRTSYVRTGDAARQPFSADTPNTLERPRQTPPDAVVIGGYSSDGSLAYVRADGTVARCDRDDGTPLNEWANLFTMLTAEANRLAKYFDASGRLVSGGGKSAPPPTARVE